MSHVANQQRTLLRLLSNLRPYWTKDANLPARIQSLLSANRSFGSRDRRLYRELIYATLRYLPWIEPGLETAPDFTSQVIAWLAAETPATHAFRADLTVAWPVCPSSVGAKVAVLQKMIAAMPSAPSHGHAEQPFFIPLPDWFRTHCPAAFEPAQTDALLARAPLWLRLQTQNTASVFEEFERQGWTFRRSELLPTAVELQTETDVAKTDAYQRGGIEVQDLGSQLILEAIGLKPGERWLDACAGAGGKTLQLSRLLSASGQVDAHDIRPAALAELTDRGRRAGINVTASVDRRSRATESVSHQPALRTTSAPISIVTTPTLDARYDGVLVDAPCSGSGTWRRSPHLKWTTTPAQIAEAARLQISLLHRFSQNVREGGRLIYATCSMSHVENDDVVAEFLATHPDFAAETISPKFGFESGLHGFSLLPAAHNTDGFYVSALRRR